MVQILKPKEQGIKKHSANIVDITGRLPPIQTQTSEM